MTGQTWFLFEDEDLAKATIDTSNECYESAFDDFSIDEESDDGRRIKVSYSGDHDIEILYKIRRVKWYKGDFIAPFLFVIFSSPLIETMIILY